MYLTHLKLILIDIKEMFRSSPPAVTMSVLLFSAPAWAEFGIIGVVFSMLSYTFTAKLALSTPLITGELKIFNTNRLRGSFLIDVIAISSMIVIIAIIANIADAYSATPVAVESAVGYIRQSLYFLLSHLISPLLMLYVMLYIFLYYYTDTYHEHTYATLKLLSPTCVPYLIVVAVLSVLASLLELSVMVSFLGCCGLFRRYIFETPPKKKLDKVRKPAEAL